MSEVLASEAELKNIQGRGAVLLDIGYILLTIYVYLISLFMPFIGFVFGGFLLLGGAHPKTRSVGKICLILGAVNLMTTILFFVVIASSGMLRHMRF